MLAQEWRFSTVKARGCWKKDEGNVWHIEMLDIKGDGHDKIIHSDAKGNLLVRDAQGSDDRSIFAGFLCFLVFVDPLGRRI